MSKQMGSRAKAEQADMTRKRNMDHTLCGKIRCFIFGAVATALAGGAAAQDDPLGALGACREIEDSSEKLACFEIATDALFEARERGDVHLVQSEAVESLERRSFGLDSIGPLNLRLGSLFSRRGDGQEERQPAFDAAAVEAETGVVATKRGDDGEIIEASMVVKSARRAHDNRLVVTMENGQIWRQVDADRVQIPRNIQGASVSIRRASLGSYILSFEGRNRGVRVRRDD